MRSWSNIRPLRCLAILGLLMVFAAGCKKSGPKEPPVTGKRTDPPLTMTASWQEGRRYIFRAETTISTQVPRKNTTQLIQTHTSLGQELAFHVSEVAPDGSRVLRMELLSVQFETGRDDDTTLSFDSLNQVMQVEDTPLIQRLRKLIGLKLAFRLSPSNKVTRVDGTKDLNDRISSGNNAIRGVAAQVVSRCVNQQFYRDIVEMGFLPPQPVKPGESWTIDRASNVNPRGGSGMAHYTYTFTGWQEHLGSNCARIDFTAEFKPPGPPTTNTMVTTNSPGTTNQSVVRRVMRQQSANIEEGSISGQSWYSPDLTLAIDTVVNQSATTKTAIGRRTTRTVTNAVASASNTVEIVDIDSTPPDPAPTPSGTNAPPVMVSTTTHQATRIRLVDVEWIKP